ncbi:class I SAM-dependent methyltransferase [Phytoactinopolyspora endophytica]|uniref:class I SAM-dependent methyltransferase n=1 Tax=Phytoactinopolyspora endophytica TaxID=1642495 RepID=UPI00101CC60A|nr:class I SAM-dependent methyltransferase [Phytoactinopolyspora endophytica]
MSWIDLSPWGAVEPLLRAAGSGYAQLRETVRQAGLQSTMDVVVNELRLRYDPPQNTKPVSLQLEVTFDTERAGRVITFDHADLVVEPGWTNSPAAWLRFDIIDLLESLFGPFKVRRHASLEVARSDHKAMHSSTASGTTAADYEQVGKLIHSLLDACLAKPDDLGELSVRFGSDKETFHRYMRHYEQHFARFRNQPIRLLEIGIGGGRDAYIGGGSLLMWQRYFKRGLVYGLDLFNKPNVHGPRIRTVRGDQNDHEFLDNLGLQFGPFDVIIDDGSHINEHIMTSISGLFPYVRSGGFYVIEDLCFAYWSAWNRYGDDAEAEMTSIDMIKSLIDGLHHQEAKAGLSYTPSYMDLNVAGMHVYHNIVMLEKGRNSDSPILPVVQSCYSPDVKPSNTQ